MFAYDTGLCQVPALTAFEAIRRLLGEEDVLSNSAIEALEVTLHSFGESSVLEGYAKQLQNVNKHHIPAIPIFENPTFEPLRVPVVDLANLQIVHCTPVGVLRVCFTNAGVGRLDFVPLRRRSVLEEPLDAAALLIASLASDQNDIWTHTQVENMQLSDALDLARQAGPSFASKLENLIENLYELPMWELELFRST